MKRSDLKMLIKECLVELLAEGLGQGLNETISHNRSLVTTRTGIPTQHRRRPQHDPVLDRKVVPQVRNALQEAIKIESRGNSLMADLLADTAVTTLQTQYANGDNNPMPSLGGSGPGITQQEQFAGNPEEVFGEASSKWAELAFAPAVRRPQG
jgi:hypothetical protein